MPDVTIAADEVSTGELDLEAGLVSTVTFDDNVGTATLVNTSDTADVWFTVDGTSPVAGDPGSWPLLAGWIREDFPTVNSGAGDVVKLISVGTPTVIITRGT